MKLKKSYRPLIALVWLSLAVVLASCVATKVSGTKPPAKAPFKLTVPPLVLGNGPNEGGGFFRLFRPNGLSTSSETLPEITTDSGYALSIRTPLGGPTNLNVRAYYTRVATNVVNPAFPSNTSYPLGSNYFDAISGYFTGTQSVALNTNVGEWTDVYFQFKTNGFVAANQGDGFITFVARGTNSSGQVFEGLYAYRFISPL